MALPGFSAETSLYQTKRRYALSGAAPEEGGSLTPAGAGGWDVSVADFTPEEFFPREPELSLRWPLPGQTGSKDPTERVCIPVGVTSAMFPGSGVVHPNLRPDVYVCGSCDASLHCELSLCYGTGSTQVCEICSQDSNGHWSCGTGEPVYGNWCGPSFPQDPGINPTPLDAVDAACEAHDKCYRQYGKNDCQCNLDLINAMPQAIANSPTLSGKIYGWIIEQGFKHVSIPGLGPNPCDCHNKVCTGPGTGGCQETKGWGGRGCPCPRGQYQCDGTCIDVQNDDSNCGSCGNACSGEQTCQSGVCACPDAGQTYCSQSGACTDLSNDYHNCGSCGNACSIEGQTCVNGVCQCGGGFSVPGHSSVWEVCGNACTDVANDPNNCRTCGNACPGGASCQDMFCKCPDVFTGKGYEPGTPIYCDGSWSCLTSDSNNCGSCGNVCAEGQICTDGSCYDPCHNPDYPDYCSKLQGCTNLNWDINNCGTCDKDCTLMGYTVAGCCDGQCTDLSTTSNCRGCGFTCSTNQVCDTETGCVCPEPYTQCPQGCLNLSTDTNHCGTCGHDCSQLGTGYSCCDGTCVDNVTQGCCDNRVTNLTAVNTCGSCGNDCTLKGYGSPACCGGACADFSASPNCGSCGMTCSTNQVCAPTYDGGYGCVCPPGGDFATCSDGSCVNIQTDPANCGSCGSACPSGATCEGGACHCAEGTIMCGGQCVNPQTDLGNCGSCGKTCDEETQTCQGGSCECTDSSLENCGSSGCKDTSSDASNCGNCGNDCAKYGPNYGCCDGTCTDLTTNENCGGCNTTNPDFNCSVAYNYCSCQKDQNNGYGCHCDPNQGATNCNGECRLLQTDPEHCGSCNNKCNADSNCSEGRCVCKDANLTICGSSCADLATDDNNCGDCGNKCPTGTNCDAGVCGCAEG
jgi:hypothetical protein